jgi:hypothetical protein
MDDPSMNELDARLRKEGEFAGVGGGDGREGGDARELGVEVETLWESASRGCSARDKGQGTAGMNKRRTGMEERRD